MTFTRQLSGVGVRTLVIVAVALALPTTALAQSPLAAIHSDVFMNTKALRGKKVAVRGDFPDNQTTLAFIFAAAAGADANAEILTKGIGLTASIHRGLDRSGAGKCTGAKVGEINGNFSKADTSTLAFDVFTLNKNQGVCIDATGTKGKFAKDSFAGVVVGILDSSLLAAAPAGAVEAIRAQLRGQLPEAAIEALIAHATTPVR